MSIENKDLIKKDLSNKQALKEVIDRAEDLVGDGDLISILIFGFGFKTRHIQQLK